VALLEARGITVRFGGHNAVTAVDLDVEAGHVTGLIGPNGAGKTTIFNAITGLQPVSSGVLRLAGREIGHEPPRVRARLGIARTFQQLEIFGSLTVRENIRTACEIRRRWARDLSADVRRDTDAILERVGLRSVADERADTLPTGLARLCELGRALATRPRLLLLDEPASGLSDRESEDLAALLQALGSDDLAILLVEHDVVLVMRVCTTIHVIDYGALIAVGSPEEIAQDARVVEAYLGATPAPSAPEPPPAGADPPRRDLAAATRPARLPARLPPALELRRVRACYGQIEVLHGVDLTLPTGNVVALLGPNGSGKSTALKVASGQLAPSGGCIHLAGRHVNGASTDAVARVGVCTIPEGRGVFPNLTVRENLVMATYTGIRQSTVEERAYARFPRLRERRFQLAGTLSGGEQRMLAMARALATEPAVLLLDELSMGLAPLIVEELYELVAEIAQSGVSILVVEQFVRVALGVAQYAAVLVQGRVVASGRPDEIEDGLASAYLGVSA
jgi:ABC-type branched-subunit amino acid transport system ATPase component